MTPEYLRNLGSAFAGRAQLAENMTTTANVDAFVRDLKKKLLVEPGKAVQVSIRSTGTNGGKVAIVEYLFDKKLTEEAVEVKPAQDIWTENKDSAKTYVSNTVYFVKKLENEKYDVTTEEGTTRKPFAVLSKIDLDKSFTPIRAKQTPDAEGYTQYRDLEELEAFKSDADTVKLDNDELLAKGDYLIRKTDGTNFTYEVKKAKDFEAQYEEK
jgi:hypothetical protein